MILQCTDAYALENATLGACCQTDLAHGERLWVDLKLLLTRDSILHSASIAVSCQAARRAGGRPAAAGGGGCPAAPASDLIGEHLYDSRCAGSCCLPHTIVMRTFE